MNLVDWRTCPSPCSRNNPASVSSKASGIYVLFNVSAQRIHQETIQPHVVHTTKPIHETHHLPAEHHGISTLQTMSLGNCFPVCFSFDC